jgi:hypothetical protein
VPKYFFHLRDGEDVLLDPEGMELADAEAIAAQALFEARSILSHDVMNGRIHLGQRIDVETAEGVIVHSLPFSGAVEILP